MREIDRTRVVRAGRSRMHQGFSASLAAVLCLLFSVVGTSFLSEVDLRVSAVQPLQNAAETSTRSAIKLSGQVSVDQGLIKSDQSEDDLWRAREVGIKRTGPGRESYRAVSLNEFAQRKLLSHAPMEFTSRARQTPVVMTLPMPNGTFARFRVEESPVMEAGLAANSPDIRTYRGRGVDDPTVTTRFDVTRAGLHAIVLSSKDTVIVEPASHGRPGQYVSYDQSHALKEASSFSCVLLGAEQLLAQSKTTTAPR
jgi:hypothetical protein